MFYVTNKRLVGKTALVTAAGQGIGLASAERFAFEGATVLATDINTGLLANVRGCRTHHLDVTDPMEVGAVISEAGPIDVLFNCAGYVHTGTILECDETAWKFSLDLNITAMYRLIGARTAWNAETRRWIDYQHVVCRRSDQGGYLIALCTA
jgi:2-keto-3-deoxy-L-fuconate dehydrogenase